MAKTSPRKPKKNWYNIYDRFLSRTYHKIKSKKFFAILILSAPILYFVLTMFSNIKTGYADVKAIIKSDNLNESTKIIESNNTLNNNSLFSIPFHFSKNSVLAQQGDYPGTIEFSNQDLYINISPANSPCGLQYELINIPNSSSGITHKFLPVYENNFEQEQPDFYRLEEVERLARKNYGYPPTKEDLRQEREEKKYENFDYDSLEKSSPCYLPNSGSEGLEMPIKYQNPGLEIKLNNNSTENILIHDSYILVNKSKLNSFPMIEFGAGSMYDLPIFNEGWGDATNIRMTYNIQKVDAPLKYDVEFKYQLNISRLKPTDNINHYYDVDQNLDLKKALELEGVKTKKLDNWKILEKYQIREIASKAGIFGRFTNGHARIVGKLYYEGYTADGKLRADTLNFNFFQNLWPHSFGGDSYYVKKAPYNIRFKLSDTPYNIPVRISESIGPKSAGRFTLFFDCPKSSYHLFDLVIRYNNGKQLIVKDIFLNYFMRKTDRDTYSTFRKPVLMKTTKR